MPESHKGVDVLCFLELFAEELSWVFDPAPSFAAAASTTRRFCFRPESCGPEVEYLYRHQSSGPSQRLVITWYQSFWRIQSQG